MNEYVWVASYVNYVETDEDSDDATIIGVFPEITPRAIEVCRGFIESQFGSPRDNHEHWWAAKINPNDLDVMFGTQLVARQTLYLVANLPKKTNDPQENRATLADLTLRRYPLGRTID